MQVELPMIGVDVSKDDLSIDGTPGPGRLKIRNTRGAIGKWLSSLPVGSAIAMESTGRYHQLVALMAHDAGMRVFVLNARSVWFYARGEGQRSKTDRVDALLIRRFLVDKLLKGVLKEWCPGTPLQREIEVLLRRRQSVERHQTAMRMAMREVSALASEVNSAMEKIDHLLQGIDRRIQELTDCDEVMRAKRALLETITGVGPQASAAFASLFSRIPFKNADAVVAYSGLDPRANDSGTKHGRRRISKQGPAYLRKQVWLCGLSVTNSKVFKSLYKALLSRRLPTTAAIMILGRRILRIAWSVWTTDQPFDAQRVTRPA